MSTLVLIGTALIAAGFVLLALRFMPRVRRQFAATATQPRTVADLVRLRADTDAAGVSPASVSPALAPPGRPVPPPPPRVALPAAARREPSRVDPPAPEPAPPAARQPAPVHAAAGPVRGRVWREPEPTVAPPISLDGDNAPWKRGARMVAGLGGGQPWREPPPPPAQLRIVPSTEAPAEPAASEEVTTPVHPAATGPRHAAEPAEPAPVRLVPTEPTPDDMAERSPARPVAAESATETASDASAVVPEDVQVDEPAPDEPGSAAPVESGPVESGPVESGLVEPGPVETVPVESVVGEGGLSGPAVPDAGPAPSAERMEGPAEASPDMEVPPAAGGLSEPVDAREPDGSAERDEPAPIGSAAPQQAVWTEPVASVEPAADGPRSAAPGSGVPEDPAPSDSPDPESGQPAAAPGSLAATALGSAAIGAAGVLGAARPAEPANAAPESGPGPAEISYPDGWDNMEAEDVPAGAVPDRFAEDGPSGEPPAGRRGRQTPDERAAEQAAADLALLRTFGFADPGLRPDSAPVVAMERPEEQEPSAAVGDAQPVRYRVIRRDGSVVGGATVTLLDDRGGDVAAGAADAEGRGEVLAPTQGSYVLVSTAEGHQPGAVAITVADASTAADVLLARSASVSGSVRGEDGPVAGARVTLVQDGEAVDAVDTDADGRYRIGDIGAGEYGLSVAAAGCEPVASLLDVAEEADVRHDVELSSASPVADDGGVVGDDLMSGRR